jgi:hypothetical protein
MATNPVLTRIDTNVKKILAAIPGLATLENQQKILADTAEILSWADTPIRARMTFSFAGASFTGDDGMAITLPDDAPIQVKVTWVDAKGNVAIVDGATTWTSSDDANVSVVVDSTDSTMATMSSPAGGTLVTAQVSASADADRGSGVETIIAMVDVTVVAGTAVGGTISPVPAP